MLRPLITLGVLALAGPFWACGPPVKESPIFNTPDQVSEVDEDPTAMLLGGQGVGKDCITDAAGFSDCRPFLKCVQGTCRATGDTQEGYYCILSDECDEGLYCSLTAKCEPGGQGAHFASCITEGDCAKGLYCEPLGLGGYCVPAGGGDIGAICLDRRDCMAGLKCAEAGTCAAGKLGIDLSLWPGRECAEVEGAARVLFQIPSSPTEEFFRLPFPNDLRLNQGRINLDGFPRPGTKLLDVDFVQRLTQDIADDQEGFSKVPAVYFRFSQPLATDTLVTAGDGANLRFVNVDAQSPAYGELQGFSWYASASTGNRYICGHWLKLQASWSAPLASNGRYAVLLLKGMRATSLSGSEPGPLLEADDDLSVLLGGSKPIDPILADAWTRYTALRAYLTDQEIPVSEVVGATLFTTQDPARDHALVRAAVDAWEPKPPQLLTLCDGAAQSPCDDGETGERHIRGCFEANDDVWELHMKVPLPMIQEGVRPYLIPAAGGALRKDAAGNVVIESDESVCVSLTIPKHITAGPEGYPLVIGGHGTRGSFRSMVTSTSRSLADIDVGGQRVGAAMLSWDGPMHGPRRGSPIDPELLYFNMANPKAARGNSLQGFADILALVNVVKAFSLNASESPTGTPITFDMSRLAFLGHSQGAGYGVPAVAYSPEIDFGIWSGAGAGLLLSLLGKTSPSDTRAGIGYALGEISESGQPTLSDHHPVLTLIQGYFDPIDPLHVARKHIFTPTSDVGSKHVLLSYGLGDTFTPPASIETLARAFGVPQLAGSSLDFGPPIQPPPISGNFGGGKITGGVAVANDEVLDGHFVLFGHPEQHERLRHAVGSWILSGIPTLQ